MNKWKRLVVLFAIPTMVAVAGYGIYVQIHTVGEVSSRMEETLIGPYAEALKSGAYELAWDFLSAEYRQACPLEAYVRAQQQNAEQYGVVQEISIKEHDPFQSSFNLFSWKKYYQGGLLYRGEKEEYWVNWEVVTENEMFRIGATYLVHRDSLLPGIY